MIKRAIVASMLVIQAGAATSPIGLVLSGGGAKGAYEVGVWQALHEAGLAGDIVAVSGTSIGAVNAALFAFWPDPKGAERLWLENLGKVFVPNDRILQVASERKFAEFLDVKLHAYAEIAGVPASSLPEDSRKAIEREARDEFTRKGILRDLAAALKTYQDWLVGDASDGLCDGNALRSTLEENLPKNWSRATPRVYATALMTDERRPHAFCLNDGTAEDRILRLLASTAIPVVFPPVKIDGKTYIDGGCEGMGGNNTPLKPILDHHPDIKTMIVVYLNDEKNLGTFRRAKNRNSASAAGICLVEIIPSKDISGAFGVGGVFDTSPETARRLIELGRKDARKTLAAAGIARSAER